MGCLIKYIFDHVVICESLDENWMTYLCSGFDCDFIFYWIDKENQMHIGKGSIKK